MTSLDLFVIPNKLGLSCAKLRVINPQSSSILSSEVLGYTGGYPPYYYYHLQVTQIRKVRKEQNKISQKYSGYCSILDYFMYRFLVFGKVSLLSCLISTDCARVSYSIMH